jgi:hypothetical protein
VGLFHKCADRSAVGVLRFCCFAGCVAGLLGAGAVPLLTPVGWGNLRIGMSEREAVRRFHLTDEDTAGVNSEACRELKLPGQPQLTVMAEEGRITRISLDSKGSLQAAQGLTVGSSEAAVRRVYGKALRTSPHHYEAQPAHYLTVWTKPRASGIRFETDAHRRVTRIHVGGPAIEYVEGCL